jgi:hypothetical protein
MVGFTRNAVLEEERKDMVDSPHPQLQRFAETSLLLSGIHIARRRVYVSCERVRHCILIGRARPRLAVFEKEKKFKRSCKTGRMVLRRWHGSSLSPPRQSF